MKAVMISIRPRYVRYICWGEKTIEVRKTMPKLELPFKCYIYCTMGKHENTSRGMILKDDDLWKTIDNNVGMGWHYLSDHINDITIRKPLNGKVVAEFTCDRIFDIVPCRDFDTGYCVSYEFRDCEYGTANHCLLFKELDTYLKGNYGYAWHISDLKIYDKPRELEEFYSAKQCKDWDKNMDDCVGHGLDYQEKCKHCIGGYIPLTRPPQSWFYVEDL